MEMVYILDLIKRPSLIDRAHKTPPEGSDRMDKSNQGEIVPKKVSLLQLTLM